MENVKAQLSRFKQETGMDFFELMNGKPMVFKTINDTDNDEKENQQIYELMQKEVIAKN